MTTPQTAIPIDSSVSGRNPAVHAADGRRARADDEQAILAEYLAAGNLDDLIPRIARDRRAIERVEAVVRGLDTGHELVHGDAGQASALAPNSIHLVVTSPPYWTLKRYNEHEHQLGHEADYDEFNARLEEVWRNCYRAQVPGAAESLTGVNRRAEVVQ